MGDLPGVDRGGAADVSAVPLVRGREGAAEGVVAGLPVGGCRVHSLSFGVGGPANVTPDDVI